MTKSDTPRTDAMIFDHIHDPVTGECEVAVVHADDCRALERELNHWRGMYRRASDAIRTANDEATAKEMLAKDAE